MSHIVTKLAVTVTSIQQKPQERLFQVRALVPPGNHGLTGSIYFDMDDPNKAPLIGEGLQVTVEDLKNDSTPTITPNIQPEVDNLS